MMEYPKNYASLGAEEMEYTGGGFDIDWSAVASLALGAGTMALGYMNVAGVGSMAASIKNAYPEEYPEPDGAINLPLMRDATLVYFTSPSGLALGALNLACAVGYAWMTMSWLF